MKLNLIGEKHGPYEKEQCSLKVDIIHQFLEHHIPFDVFSDVTYLDDLVRLLVDESNLYAQQNGREFYTKEQEMRTFIGIKYTISINKVPTIQSYYCNVNSSLVTRDHRDLKTLYKVFIFRTTQKMTKVTIRSLINHFNQSFSDYVSMMILKAFTSIW